MTNNRFIGAVHIRVLFFLYLSQYIGLQEYIQA